MRSLGFLSTLVLLAVLPSAIAVKEHDFKKCDQAGFCRRGRALAARARNAGSSWLSPYSVDSPSVTIAPDSAVATAAVKNSLHPDINFSLELRVHDDGVVRVRMDEVGGLRKRYDEAASWALIREPSVARNVKWTAGKKDLRAKFGEKGENEVVVTYTPLRVALLRNGKEQVVLNGGGLLHMEHFRNRVPKESEVEVPNGDGEAAQVPLKVENPAAWFEGETEDDWWEERWSTWTDTKPKGPESLSIDISFPNHGTVYGIPQHATSLALPTTSGDAPFFSDPYRLYNADVFEYAPSSPMSIYGSIPVLHAHSVESTVAIFHAIASETWIDVAYASERSTQTHWVSESGILDLFLMPGPTPERIFGQYSRLTGTTALPAHWSLGYHQCRWNYVSSEDIRTVQKRMDEEEMPVDVFWLDIEYSQDHMYMIWDKKHFPDPVDMISDVAALGRKMVIIVDPHLKRTNDYPVYREAQARQLFVKNALESEYEGWCWSGSSAWIDFFNPAVWEWWKKLFKPYQLKSDEGWSWTESTEAVHIWNDMNEPSVFNGPEISMPRDNIHHGGWEHRDVHNINGMLYSNLTSQAIAGRSDPPKRPFVLTRAFYAGSQRFGAMWTGDNACTWEHMAVGVKIILSMNIAGFPFAGSDVGGFFGNPEPEILVRWYQVGAFGPFFRAHAHLDTKRREPFLLEQPYKDIVRDVLRLRYSLLPVWYTAFREASVSGMPVVRPQYVVHPKDPAGFAIDDQFYVGGSGLLVKPVTEKGVTETTMYLADKEVQVYYDYFTHHAHRGPGNVSVPAALHQIPLLVRGGSILATRERPRRASTAMRRDPFTLRVALSSSAGGSGSARGELYLDDGESYAHHKGEFVWRGFTAHTDGKKRAMRVWSEDLGTTRTAEAVDPYERGASALERYNAENEFARGLKDVRVEKVVVVGLGERPKNVRVEGGKELEWEYTSGVGAAGKERGTAGVLNIKDPQVLIAADWAIIIQW